ncbi:hypothetical protein G7046_g2464 [Stylonectria norvegica]|nr:hypothetical protein G7046_g2464 [Stylonectria norvegica]
MVRFASLAVLAISSVAYAQVEKLRGRNPGEECCPCPGPGGAQAGTKTVTITQPAGSIQTVTITQPAGSVQTVTVTQPAGSPQTTTVYINHGTTVNPPPGQTVTVEHTVTEPGRTIYITEGGQQIYTRIITVQPLGPSDNMPGNGGGGRVTRTLTQGDGNGRKTITLTNAAPPLETKMVLPSGSEQYVVTKTLPGGGEQFHTVVNRPEPITKTVTLDNGKVVTTVVEVPHYITVTAAPEIQRVVYTKTVNDLVTVTRTVSYDGGNDVEIIIIDPETGKSTCKRKESGLPCHPHSGGGDGYTWTGTATTTGTACEPVSTSMQTVYNTVFVTQHREHADDGTGIYFQEVVEVGYVVPFVELLQLRAFEAFSTKLPSAARPRSATTTAMFAFSRRLALLGSLIFVVLMMVMVFHDRVLPTNVAEHIPDMPDLDDVEEHLRLPSMLRPEDHLNGTKQRYWTSKDTVLSGVADWERPIEVKAIKGLVFYGRRTTVSILDCYLKRNLVKNGGMLDAVIFVERTEDKDDLELLEKLIQSEEVYERWRIEMDGQSNFDSGFGISYERIENDVLYIKMDDDIVFMEDAVIPSLIQTKLSRPDLYVVSANVVNQPLLSWVHHNLGAVKPYLPEVDGNGKPVAVDDKAANLDWRTSSLPAWGGPDDFKVLEWKQSEDHKHRWLPRRSAVSHVLDDTPVVDTEYDAFGKGWTLWQIGAQEHYSLLENLEKNELWRYKFGTWDFQYQRMGIQFIAMMGKDINDAKPIPSDDENHFSCTMPKKLGRHGVADGRGVAAHYSFGSQRPGMRWTDILDRYRAFAKENICASPMLWIPEDDIPEAEREKKPEVEMEKVG